MIYNDEDEWRGYKSPCYMCEHRKSHCHSTCIFYAKYKSFLQLAAKQEYKGEKTAATEKLLRKNLKWWQ